MLPAESSVDSCCIDDLPDEILRKIVLFLNSDLKNASQVCTRWRYICSEPKLWKNFRLCINFKNVDMTSELLYFPRLKIMRSVKFLSWFVSVRTSEYVIREISKHSGDIDELIIRGNGLVSGNGLISDLNPFLLASCVNNMRSLVLSKTWLSKEQLGLIFFYMKKETNLKELDISENDLSSVDEDMLATCLKKMKIASLRNTLLLVTQMENMLVQRSN